jgi:pectate lyase
LTGSSGITASSSKITYVYLGSESLAIEWTASSVSGTTVYYKLHTSSDTSYTKVDSQLVRMSEDGTARVDIVGLSAGTYDVKIVTSTDTYYVNTINVTSYDRSGYAHFGYSDGVGAYNDDGTLKTGAQIVYVTEETKNTVSLKIDGTTYTGIVNILGAASKLSNPLVVRVVGQVSAATWNSITYTPANSKNGLTLEEVTGANGKKLYDYVDTSYFDSNKRIYQSDLIALGFNTLNTSEYAELNGLTSFIKYDSSKSEFDSCWNDCRIKNASNITVEGIGEDAMLFQWGLTWIDCKSIEVRNLTFDDYTEDACSFEGSNSYDSITKLQNQSSRIWVHNNTFNEGINYWDVCNEQDKHEGDGATDFKKLSNVTISYNHYYKNHKTGLIGSGNGIYTANITFHHNFYDQCKSRLPLSRQANMHMYNNYYYKASSSGVSLRAYAYALIENCYFESCTAPINIQGYSSTTASSYGVAKLYGTKFVSCKDYTYDAIADSDTSKKSSMIVVATSRDQVVANNNTLTTNFDTNSSEFYYDATNKRSDVESMLTADQTKELVPSLAGALTTSKRTNALDGKTADSDSSSSSSGTTDSEVTTTAPTISEFTLTAANLPSGALTSDNDGTAVIEGSPILLGDGVVSIVYNSDANANNNWKLYGNEWMQALGAKGEIDIDLTEYSGNATITIVSRTTGPNNTGRYYIIEGNGVTLYSSGYNTETGITNTAQTDTFVLKCGYKYTLKTSAGLRFSTFSFAPTDDQCTATMPAPTK